MTQMLTMVSIYILALLALASSTPISREDPREDVDYRLPTTIKPLRYHIKLVPYIVEGNFTFDGDVLMSVLALEATSSIVFHVNKLEIDVASISVKDYFLNDEIQVMSTTWNVVTHFYTLELASALKVGGQYTIHIGRYTGILDADMHGFYRSYYKENGQTRWLAATQFESTDARRTYPCFDEPALKAQITLSISRPENMRALSNMPQAGTPEEDTENTDTVRYWDHFEETPLMSTYLLAIIVSDFVFLEDAANDLRVYSQPLMVSQARYSLSVSPPILNWLADYTAIPFHLPKVYEAAIPDFEVGAEENWGLVTYREHRVLFEEGSSPSSSRQSIATTIAHEYAHQWFGDLVSPLWWMFTWLNEGFATFFEFHTHIDPTWRLEEQFVAIKVHEAMALDSSQNSHPMTVDVATPSSIDSIFDGISYAKSGSVLRMMKHFISPETFQKGIQRYLLDRSYKAAQADDLFAIMNDQLHLDDVNAADLDIKKVMDTWTLQMGYPVVTVTRDYTAQNAQLKQERFILTPILDHPDTHDYRWHVPLSYTTQAELDFVTTSPKDWFNVEEEMKMIGALPDDTQWILFNIAQTSFYRVNYDQKNWDLLAAHLDSDKYEGIIAVNRGQLLDDSFNIARAGKLPYSTPLALSKYLKREVDYIPWYSAFVAFTYIDMNMNIRTDYDTFKGYLLKLMSELKTTVGYDALPNDDHVTRLNRGSAVKWACNLGDASCLSMATTLFKRWMETPENNPISPDLKSAVYCAALKAGGKAEWDFLWSQYLTTRVATESVIIISALGCSTDPDILTNYMHLAVTEGGDIRRQDSGTAFTSVFNNPSGVDVAIDFIIAEYKTIAAFNGGNMGSVGGLTVNIAGRCNDRNQWLKMSDFLTTNYLELGSAVSAIERAVQIIEENLEWQDAHAQEIIDWIGNNPI